MSNAEEKEKCSNKCETDGRSGRGSEREGEENDKDSGPPKYPLLCMQRAFR